MSTSTFVVAKAPGRSIGAAKLMVTALRSLLDFLHVQGLLANSLAAIVPTVAGSRLAGLPKGLAAGQVQQLLTSCDRRTAVGRRDFGGEAAKGTSGVVDAVANGQGTIGYADASAAKELGHADLLVGGKWMQPTAEAAAKILDESTVLPNRPEHDLALKLNRKSGDAYPAVLVSYALVCQTYKDANDASMVKGFIGYAASVDGQKSAAAAAGSAPLSSSMQSKVKASIDSIK